MAAGAGTGGPSLDEKRIERLEQEQKELRTNFSNLHADLTDFRSNQAATNAVLQKSVDDQGSILKAIDVKLDEKTEPKPFPWPVLVVVVSIILGSYYFTVEQFRQDVADVYFDTVKNREDVDAIEDTLFTDEDFQRVFGNWRERTDDRMSKIEERAIRNDERLQARLENSDCGRTLP